VLKRVEQLGIDESSRAAWSQTWIILGFDAIEARLAGTNGPFALGLAPGLADIFIVPQVYNAKRFGVNLAPYRRIREIDVAASRLTAFAQSEPRSQPDAE
jgi:maleylpyruvate isomerase